MKKTISFLICSAFLLSGCVPQATILPTATDMHPTTAQTPSLTPAPLPTSTATSTWTPASPSIPDTDCMDAETFETGAAVYYESSQLVHMGNGQLYGIDWSKDGKRIAIGSETGIHIFDARTMQPVKYIETPYDVEVVRFSPDGKWIATDDHSQVVVWDVETGELISRFGETVDFYSVRWGYPFRVPLGNISFHPGGNLVAIHSMNYSGMDSSPSIEIWNIQTRKLVREWKAEKDEKDFFVPDPIFSPDGKWIASPWKNGINIWNVETGEVFKHISSESKISYFSPNGKQLIVNDSDRIRIFDIERDTSVSIFPGNSYEPVTGTISVDGTKLVTHYSEGKEPYSTPVAIWDTKTGKKLRELNIPDFVLGLVINPVKNELATIGYTKDQIESIRIWDLETGVLVRQLKFSQQIGREIALSPDGSKLIVVRDEHFHLYNAQTGGYLCMLQEPIEGPYFLSFSASGEKMAAIHLDGSAMVWDLETGKNEQTLMPEQTTSPKVPLAGLLTYNMMPVKKQHWDLITWAWKNQDGGIGSWMINTCDAGSSIPTDCPGAISSDGKFILTTTLDGLAIQNAHSLEVLHNFEDSLGATNFTFSPDGRYILVLSYLDWTIKIWDATTYTKIATINSGMEGEGPILGNQKFSFSADGSKLVTYLPYFQEGSVRVWNTQTWKQEKSFNTRGGVGNVAISGDGNLIAGLSGYVVYLWHLNN